MSDKETEKIVAQAELRQGLHIASANPFDDTSDNPYDNPPNGVTSDGELSSHLTIEDSKASASPVNDQKMNGSRTSDQRKGGGDAGVKEMPASEGDAPFQEYKKKSFLKRYGESMKKFLPFRCASP